MKGFWGTDMSTLITGMAQAHVNFGRWISDCPLGCGNALMLQPGETTFFCAPDGGCGHIAPIDWPSNSQEIWDALQERKAPKTRNWYPDGHHIALRAGCPTGQSPKDLRDEAAEHVG